MNNTRKMVAAGKFYPENPGDLSRAISECYNSQVLCESLIKPKILIVPHAGYQYSGPIAASSYQLAKHKKRFIIIGTSHNYPIEGIIGSPEAYWQTPFGNLKTFYLNGLPLNNLLHSDEHSIEVQLPFIHNIYDKNEICPLLMGSGINESEFLIIEKAMDGAVIIVSSDLSHYNPYPTANAIDHKTIDKILNFKPVSADEACGCYGINMAMILAKRQKLTPRLIYYRNSGDTFGDKTAVVGYASIGFF